MRIPDYLTSVGLSQGDFAGLLGVTQGQVSHWITGRSRMLLDTALKIEKITKGAVTVQECFVQSEREPAPLPRKPEPRRREKVA